jgi:hypothetical protein
VSDDLQELVATAMGLLTAFESAEADGDMWAYFDERFDADPRGTAKGLLFLSVGLLNALQMVTGAERLELLQKIAPKLLGSLGPDDR